MAHGAQCCSCLAFRYAKAPYGKYPKATVNQFDRCPILWGVTGFYLAVSLTGGWLYLRRAPARRY
ncbi:MAG: hypothetical protein ACI8WB_002836 [Phenylobacterium sp.]|jgi:hypothetical protein